VCQLRRLERECERLRAAQAEATRTLGDMAKAQAITNQQLQTLITLHQQQQAQPQVRWVLSVCVLAYHFCPSDSSNERLNSSGAFHDTHKHTVTVRFCAARQSEPQVTTLGRSLPVSLSHGLSTSLNTSTGNYPGASGGRGFRARRTSVGQCGEMRELRRPGVGRK
jgi:hypothetical protein